MVIFKVVIVGVVVCGGGIVVGIVSVVIVGLLGPSDAGVAGSE